MLITMFLLGALYVGFAVVLFQVLNVGLVPMILIVVGLAFFQYYTSDKLALMASGLEGQRFAFCGYLPREAAERVKRVKYLEKRSRQERETEIFIETPYRSDALLSALLQSCAPQSRLCVAADLTLESESVQTRTVAEWRRAGATIGRRPAVFLLLAQ